MKYTQKYQLVPVASDNSSDIQEYKKGKELQEATLLRTKSKRKQEKSSEVDIPEHKKAKELKEAMATLLKTKSKTKQAASEMAYMLKNYLHYKKYNPPDKYNFLIHIPKIYHNKVKRLIQHSSIEWNEKGEIKTVFGQAVPGSDIKELIKEALVHGKVKQPPPVGWVIFLQLLASSPLSLDFFAKAHIKKQIKAYRPEEAKRKTVEPTVKPTDKVDIKSDIKTVGQHDVNAIVKPASKRKRQPEDNDVNSEVKTSLKPSLKPSKALKQDATAKFDVNSVQPDINADQGSVKSKWLKW